MRSLDCCNNKSEDRPQCANLIHSLCFGKMPSMRWAVILTFFVVLSGSAYWLFNAFYPLQANVYKPQLLFEGEKQEVVLGKTYGFKLSQAISLRPFFEKNVSFLELYENGNKFLRVERISTPADEGNWYRYTLYSKKSTIVVPDQHPRPARWLRTAVGDWEAKKWLSDPSEKENDIDMQILFLCAGVQLGEGEGSCEVLETVMTFLPKNYRPNELTLFNLWRKDVPLNVLAKTNLGEATLFEKVRVQNQRYRVEKESISSFTN